MATPDPNNPVELRRMVSRLAALVETSLTLNSTLDPESLLHSIIETATRLLGCEAVSVLLFDEPSGQLRFAMTTTPNAGQLSQIPVPLEGSIAGTVFRENRPIFSNDPQADPRHFTRVGEQTQFVTRSMVAVPMRIREKTTGVLEALNKSSGAFNVEDVHILSIIASQAAVAIHNARLVQELQHAYAELSRADQLKTNVLSLASHELRTPLGIILGYAAFLKEEAQGELGEHASQVLNAALQMRSVLEGMSHLNFMRMGELELQRHTQPLQDILRTAVEDLSVMARTKNQSLIADLPSEPLWVAVDADRMQLAISNLLNNAVRFSPAGTEITLSASPVDGQARLVIHDQGIGIPPHALERIFEAFYQVEQPLTRRYGGLGLGLTIARGIIELHGGRLWAESPGLGQGSTFTAALPLVAPA